MNPSDELSLRFDLEDILIETEGLPLSERSKVIIAKLRDLNWTVGLDERGAAEIAYWNSVDIARSGD